MSAWSELARWLYRSRPGIGHLTRAVAGGALATGTGLALFVGAPYLLFYSVSHHDLVAGGTLALLLLAIELLAFLRAPARFVERMSSHELGLQSVTQWRRWLTTAVGTWPYRRWAAAATGDLLDRALADTDALQDLWLRAVVPVTSSVLALLAADVAVLFLPGDTGPAAGALLMAQLVCLGAGALMLRVLVSAETEVRRARAGRTSVRLELQRAAPELELLGAHGAVQTRLGRADAVVSRGEVRRSRRQLALSAVIGVASVGALALVGSLAALDHLQTGVQMTVVLLAVAVAEFAQVTRASVLAAAAVSAASGRLDSLEHHPPFGHQPWPREEHIDVSPIRWTLHGSNVLEEVALVVAPGLRLAVTGANGSGKSTLLRLLARLEELPDGSIRIGNCDLNEVDEVALRQHVAYVGAHPRLLTGVVDRAMRLGRVNTDDVEVALRALGITAAPGDRWVALSRGETQRAALARALLGEPSILLLDEPTSGLGTSERELVLERLDQLTATIIVATHDPALIAWCDETVVLVDGTLHRVNR